MGVCQRIQVSHKQVDSERLQGAQPCSEQRDQAGVVQLNSQMQQVPAVVRADRPALASRRRGFFLSTEDCC